MALNRVYAYVRSLVRVAGADGTNAASNVNPLPISDAGGSITVDGNVSVMPAKSAAGVLKFEPAPGQEIRADESLTDRYHGAAADNAAETDPVWAVVRFYKNGLGQIVRVRYRENVRWSERTLGW